MDSLHSEAHPLLCFAFAVFHRRHAHDALKGAAERARVVIADAFGNFADRVIGRAKKCACVGNAEAFKIAVKAHSGHELEIPAKMAL